MIIMASDTPSKYTARDHEEDRMAAEWDEREKRIAEWLQDNPQVGRLNSGKFYVYPVGGQYQEIEAFAAVPS